jgi:hypothetical protein
MSLIDTVINKIVKKLVLIVLPNKLDAVSGCVWSKDRKDGVLLLADRTKEALESRPNQEYSKKGVVAHDGVSSIVVELDTDKGRGEAEAIGEA